MSTAADEQVSAMRSLLVAHAQHDVNTAASRRLRRGIIAGVLVIGGVAGGFGTAVASGSVVAFNAPAQPQLTEPVSYYVNEIPEFKRAQRSTDMLPAATGIVTTGLVPGSVRFVGEYKDVRYYLALSGTARRITSIDLIIVPNSDPRSFVIGGASGLPFTLQNRGYAPATVPGSGHTPPAGSVRISHSVFVGPAPIG